MHLLRMERINGTGLHRFLHHRPWPPIAGWQGLMNPSVRNVNRQWYKSDAYFKKVSYVPRDSLRCRICSVRIIRIEV